MPVIDKPGTVWLQGVKELAELWNQIEGVTSVYAYAPGPFQKGNPPTISLSNIGVIIPCLVGNQFQRVVLAVTGSDIESRVKRQALEVPQAVGLVIGTKAPQPHRQPSAPIPRAEPPPESADNVDAKTDAELDAELARLQDEFANLDTDKSADTPQPPKPSPKGDPVAAKKAPARRTAAISYQNAVDHLMKQGKGSSFEVASPRDILRGYGVAEESIQPWLTKMQNKGVLSKKHPRQNGEGHCFTVYRNSDQSDTNGSSAGTNGASALAGRPAASDQDLSLEAVREHVAEINRRLDALREGGAAISYSEADGLKVCISTAFQIKIS